MALYLYPADIDDAAAYLTLLLEARAKENPAQKLTILSCAIRTISWPTLKGNFKAALSGGPGLFRERGAAGCHHPPRNYLSFPAALELETKAIATLLIQSPSIAIFPRFPGWSSKDNIEQLRISSSILIIPPMPAAPLPHI